jgi:hypothetical protein
LPARERVDKAGRETRVSGERKTSPDKVRSTLSRTSNPAKASGWMYPRRLLELRLRMRSAERLKKACCSMTISRGILFSRISSAGIESTERGRRTATGFALKSTSEILLIGHNGIKDKSIISL